MTKVCYQDQVFAVQPGQTLLEGADVAGVRFA